MDRMQRVPCLFCSVVLCCLFLCLGQEEECKDLSDARNCLLWATTQDLCTNGHVTRQCPVTCNLCGPCAQKPCASDEKCISKSTYLNGTYTCVCADGYTNGSCSESVCVGVTVCQNGGTCMVDSTSSTGYRCACRFGFTGTYCQECIDSLWDCPGWAKLGYCGVHRAVPPYCRTSCPLACPKCIRIPCQNGGTCDAKDNCNCTGTGFTGEACEVNKLCIPNPCNNGGVCTTNATCNCTGTGFLGQVCEVPVCNHEMQVAGYTYQEVPVPGLQNRSSLAFSVQACSDAHLALSTSLDLTSKMVELVIGAGGNTNQQIRLCRKTCLQNFRDGTLLSCNSPTNFWLSWETTPLTTTNTTINTTTITLGLGNVVGSGAYLSANIGKYLEVNHFSIAGYGRSNGSWVFDFPEQVNPRPCPTTTLAITTEMTSQPEVTTQTTTEVTSPPVVTTETTTETVITTETSTETPPSTPTEQSTPSHLTSETSETTPSSPYVETTSAPEVSTSLPTSPETSAESTTQPTPSTKSSSPSTTTPNPPSPPPPTQHVPKCRCRKAQSSPSQVEMAKAEEAALQLKKNLTITNTTSAQKRSKTSAHDDRPSAQTIGTVGISVLVFVFLLIVIPDLISIGCWCRQMLRGTNNKEESRKTSGALIIVEDYDKTNILPKEVVDRHIRLRHQVNQFSKPDEPGNALIKPLEGHKSTAPSSTRFNNIVPSNPGEELPPTSPSSVTLTRLQSPPESASSQEKTCLPQSHLTTIL